jgi:hypothetical protein
MPHLAGSDSLRHLALCGEVTDLSAQIDRARLNAAHAWCVADLTPFLRSLNPLIYPIVGAFIQPSAHAAAKLHVLAIAATRNLRTSDAEGWGNRQTAASVKLAFM